MSIRSLQTASSGELLSWLEEKQEWMESLKSVQSGHGFVRVQELLRDLQMFALDSGIPLDEGVLNTPYRNTIPVERQPAYPGDIALEQRIERHH